MPNYNGVLNTNEAFATLINFIISIETFAKNIYDTRSTLADMSRVDGSMYGDTKLYVSTDVLGTFDWKGDEEAANLLKLHRPPDPQEQAISISVFRMIPLTVDRFLTKRAFNSEGAFAQFNSQILAWIRDTKRVYDSTLFNTFVGTHQAGLEDTGEGARQNITIKLPAESTGDYTDLEAYNRICAQTIAEEVANLIVDLSDVSREFNDYGNLRSYDINDLVFVWNTEWVNRIKKLDMPTIFNNKELLDKFVEHDLPARYFGNVNASAGTTGGTNITVRARYEKDYNTVDWNKPGYDKHKHVFPGDLIPVNTPYEEAETYSQDGSVILKIYHKDAAPFLSGFESGSEFYNPRSLTDTHFLVWSHNELEHLKNYPFITVKVAYAEV